jgi:tRNA1Val (adenine37-N6)-methyltransferase
MAGFRFKQFEVAQDRCAMKVGTDGVLLGAWMPIREVDRRLLDIGTGTGLIALMAAQRSPQSRIVALDLLEECVAQARENADNSPWGDRIETRQGDVLGFESEPFDLIFSNPPYFESSLHSPDAARNVARHTDTLSLKGLLEAVLRLLSPGGRFAVILPVEQADRLVRLAALDLWLERRCDVQTTPTSSPRRSMLLFSREEPRQRREERLLIQHSPENYSEEYRALVADFYLKF